MSNVTTTVTPSFAEGATFEMDVPLTVSIAFHRPENEIGPDIKHLRLTITLPQGVSFPVANGRANTFNLDFEMDDATTTSTERFERFWTLRQVEGVHTAEIVKIGDVVYITLPNVTLTNGRPLEFKVSRLASRAQ